MIVGKLDICVGGRVVKLESKAHVLLMKVICPHLGGCFIGMMGGKMRIFRKIILFLPSLTMFFLAYLSFLCDNQATKFTFRYK